MFNFFMLFYIKNPNFVYKKNRAKVGYFLILWNIPENIYTQNNYLFYICFTVISCHCLQRDNLHSALPAF